jgi:hypothetical protein
MSNNATPLLSPVVEQRLLEARRAACDEMHRLIDERATASLQQKPPANSFI